MNDNRQSEFEIACATVPAPEPEPEVSENDARRIQLQTITRLMSSILTRCDSADDVGRYILSLGYQMRSEGSGVEGAPRSLEELGRRMGITKGRACQIVKKLNAEKADFKGVFTRIDDSR